MDKIGILRARAIQTNFKTTFYPFYFNVLGQHCLLTYNLNRLTVNVKSTSNLHLYQPHKHNSPLVDLDADIHRFLDSSRNYN